VERARERIASGPARVADYTDLAMGLARRARETGDSSLYDEAMLALGQAVRIDPEDIESLRVAAWVRMGRHEFTEAHRLARRYAAGQPEDPWNLGVLGDASLELGRLPEAEAAYQRMLDLLPGPASYSRAAHLLEIRGDLDGALRLMRMALDATRPRDPEDRAWLLVQVGRLHQMRGEIGAAEEAHRSALALFPGYHYALAALAGVLLAEERFGEADRFAREALDTAPHAERHLLLADARRGLGDERGAREAEDAFERLALANAGKPDNENHDLVIFYLERRRDPERALALALRESRRREDFRSLDRLALAFAAGGREAKARRVFRRILRAGVRDPEVLAHARALEIAVPAGTR
jgi:tetratricopeptide (TPR) repeat protein